MTSCDRRAASISVAAIAVLGFSISCSKPAAPAADAPAQPTNATANAPAPQPGTTPPAAGGGPPAQGPLAKGSTVRIEGRMIALTCLKENPSMTRENLDACTKDAAATGTPLAVLGTDGVVYVPEIEAEMTSEYKVFVGEDMLIDGNIHEEAKNMSWPGVTVKKMEMVRLRKKNVTPAVAGTKPTVVTGPTNGAPAPAGAQAPPKP
jgi:hypothetical protein